MKKLVLSAFAVSLILLSPFVCSQTESIDDFLGLESELLPELKGTQRFTTTELHMEKSWQVLPQNVVKDLPIPNKGQSYSIIPWSSQNPEEWLSIHAWMTDRKLKDTIPDWKIRLRQEDLKELVGKILKCYGSCQVYRGSKKVEGQFLSRILEGDEIRTDNDSVAWIYLMDGSLMRLASNTSISVNEFNVGKNEIFILARLNHGHIFWNARNRQEFEKDTGPETDAVSLPLMIRAANQEYFERKLFQKQNDEKKLSEVMELDETAISLQYQALNNIWAKNNPHVSLRTKVMLVSPNSTLVGLDASFDFLYFSGGKGYFKKRSMHQGEELSLHLRGYTSSEVLPITINSWHEIGANGRRVEALTDVPGPLQVSELLTKRIKSIELAREIWVEKFTIPLMKAATTPSILARDYGYTSWGDELSRRFDFLVEYTRRIETTNLRSLENLLVKLEGKGELIQRELSEEHYRASLNHYLLGLKSRYDHKRMKVKEMNDLQYYVWILKNAKR